MCHPPESKGTDGFIMNTNNSSIVCKRSVAELYHTGQTEYYRCFVKEFQRCSPLINRGYWLRMRAVEKTVMDFLGEDGGKRKVVVNLGCGYDPLPFVYLGKHPELCDGVTFVDVDYPQLIEKKLKVIMNNAPLRYLLPDLEVQPPNSRVLSRSRSYLAIGCDLRQPDTLESILRAEFDVDDCSTELLFLAEVSLAYMTLKASDEIFKWTSTFGDVRFCLLEQHIPDGSTHPFAKTMLNHFDRLGTPLRAIGTLEQMRERFVAAGWPEVGLDVRSLGDLWSDGGFLEAEERRALDTVEAFDEWEEFALFGCHHFLLVARKTPGLVSTAKIPLEKIESRDVTPAVKGKVFRCLAFEGDTSDRRFSALLPSPNNAMAFDTFALHGGLGTRKPLTTCDIFTDTDDVTTFALPQLPTGLMCHTITTIENTDCLLVGGRTTPNDASAACWLRKSREWTRVHDLPTARYRHNAVAVNNDTISGVIVFGGRDLHGRVLDDWLFWTSDHGWRYLDIVGAVNPEPRFGAAMALRYGTSSEGVLSGGMRQDGTVINDYWKFEVEWRGGRVGVVLRDSTTEMLEALGGKSGFLGRFGAGIVSSPQGMLLIGGVASKGLLTKSCEILDLDTKCFVAVESDDRPLFVGFCALKFGRLGGLTSDVLVLGGGADCFDFGTCWNGGFVLRLRGDGNERTSWHLASTSTPSSERASEVIDQEGSQVDVYERGRRDVQKVAESFGDMSKDVRRLYLAKLADELKELALR